MPALIVLYIIIGTLSKIRKFEIKLEISPFRKQNVQLSFLLWCNYKETSLNRIYDEITYILIYSVVLQIEKYHWLYYVSRYIININYGKPMDSRIIDTGRNYIVLYYCTFGHS